MLQSTEYRNYRTAVIFSLILVLIVAVYVFYFGKEEAFLHINKYNHPALDKLFQYWTYLGDGIIWVPLFVYVLAFKRKFFIAILASLIICTFITHFLKRVVFADELRPVLALGKEKIHIIEGFKPHTNNSFPSGHTSTAFTLALLLAYLAKNRFWVFFFPVVAFFVGYSRVYLAQHFVTDVFAGMLIGIVSSYLSLLVYKKFRERQISRQEKRKEVFESNN
ncbi:MAG: phosphatase PAP2 family protein [Flavisolibacter sp.]